MKRIYEKAEVEIIELSRIDCLVSSTEDSSKDKAIVGEWL